MKELRTSPMTQKEFREVSRELNRTASEIAKYLGVPMRTFSTWLKTESLPLLASIAIDHLQERKLPMSEKTTRRPVQRYSEMGLNVGDQIQFTPNPDLRIVVVDDKTLEFEGRHMSLTALADYLTKVTGKRADRNTHFVANGKTLRELYDETYGVRAS